MLTSFNNHINIILYFHHTSDLKKKGNLRVLVLLKRVLLSDTTGCIDCPPINSGGTLFTLSVEGVPPMELHRGDAASNSCRSLIYVFARSIVRVTAFEAWTKWSIASLLATCKAACSWRTCAAPPLLILCKSNQVKIVYKFPNLTLIRYNTF